MVDFLGGETSFYNLVLKDYLKDNTSGHSELDRSFLMTKEESLKTIGLR